MKVTSMKNTILLTIAIVGMGLAPTARAAHATTFLDSLTAEITTRLETPDIYTAAEQRALNSASKSLSKNTTTAGADLGVLASASTALGKAFTNDTTLDTLGNDALNSYITEAQADLNEVANEIGTNNAPSINNQLASAQDALDRANDTSNSVPVRARAVAFALNKLRVANIQLGKLFKAPSSLDGSVIALRGRESDRDAFNVTLNSDHTYTIAANDEDVEETGNWTYERTDTSTGTLTLSPTGGGSHTLNLKFANNSKGTFTGEAASSEEVKGSFSVAAE